MKWSCTFTVFMFVVSFGTVEAFAENEQRIIYYVGCKDNEIVSDIKESIKGVKDNLKNRNVKISRNQKDKKCGYMLINGQNKKLISTALTDYEARRCFKWVA